MATIVYLYGEMIHSFYKRHKLGELHYPQDQVVSFSSVGLPVQLKTLTHRSNFFVVIFLHVVIIGTLILWIYNIWIHPFYLGFTLAALPYLLLFKYVVEVRENGLIINGFMFNWNEIEEVEWVPKNDTKSLVILFHKRKILFKRYMSKPLPTILADELDKNNKKILALTLLCPMKKEHIGSSSYCIF